MTVRGDSVRFFANTTYITASKDEEGQHSDKENGHTAVTEAKAVFNASPP
jgi:hypothetical protein